MNLRLKDPFIVFDLDDTLYKEVTFLISAYKHISKLLEPEIGKNIYGQMVYWYLYGQSTFDLIKEHFDCKMTIQEMIFEYRYHFPDIKLSNGAKDLFLKINQSNIPMGLITDGRSISQRNKLKALGIDNLFEKTIISEEFGTEKPNENNFLALQTDKDKHFVYIGDNTAKDFLSPNLLGWTTICLLDDGSNIHKQDFSIPEEYLPQHRVENLSQLFDLVNFS